MAAYPPSYEEAVNRDPLPLLAPYLSAANLARASQVCRKWNSAFTPLLWGHPMRWHYRLHGEDPSGTIRNAFHAFLSSFSRCEPATKALIHACHVPPQPAEDAGDCEMTRMIEGLWRLSNLQALIVSNMSLLDSRALNILSEYQRDSLRLLIARNCMMASEVDLSNTLEVLLPLQYLDLSYTRVGGRSLAKKVISMYCHDLRILRMRNTGLHFSDVRSILASALHYGEGFGRHLRSLDIRDNGIRLSEMAPLPPFPAEHTPPAGVRDYYDGPQYESTVREQLVDNKLCGQELLEPENEGITHLYLSGNHNTECLSAQYWLRSFHLRVLDIASKDRVPKASSQPERLWTTIAQQGKNLASLRVSLDFLSQYPQHDKDTSEEGAPPSYEAIATGEGSSENSSPMHRFLSHLPMLSTLTIAHVPPTTTDPTLITILEQLLLACATFSARTRLPAEREHPQNPPTRPSRASQRARDLFPLQEIVLEIESRNLHSSVEDDDVETLWAAARDDFSFFEDEKPSAAVRRDIGSEGHKLLAGSSKSGAKGRESDLVDIVQHLIEWRRDRRDACSSARSAQERELAAQHWGGKLTVVRTSQSSKRVVQEDCDPFAWLAQDLE